MDDNQKTTNPSQGKILLVEDEKETANLIARFLTRRGFEVDTAYTLAEGMDKYSTTHRFVLLDIMLEGENSFSLLEKIKKENPATIVVMVSGHDSDDNIRVAKKMGADGFIAKPVISEHLEAYLLSKLVALQKKQA